MRGIYLAAYKAEHPNHNIVYQDINGKRDIDGDMMEVDLTPYDYVIATPPCNWWSRANYRRDRSEYALKTKHLLIDIIDKLCSQDKPFIIENVKNRKQFTLHGLFNKRCYVYFVGRHTYWTNIELKVDDIPQQQNSKYGGYWVEDVQNIQKRDRQGGLNVHLVIERFLETIGA